MAIVGGSSEAALARLSGLNVLWAFDVEGKGTIDPVVFARVLKRFDSEVFTDESIDALLNSLGGGGKGSKVEIQKFANMVSTAPVSTKPQVPKSLPPTIQKEMTLASTTSTPRPKSGTLVPRSPSCSRHAVALDDYMDGLVCDLEDFREAVHPETIVAASGDSPAEMEALKHQLAEKAKAYVLEAQKRNIRPVWEAFDRDKDGMLSREECAKLVFGYLKALAPKIGEVVKGTMELGAELQVILYEKKVKDPAARRRMRELAKQQVDNVYPKVAQVARETLERMAAEDPETITAELLEDLDTNHDGKVTQHEFETRFVEAIQQVLGPDRMVDKLHRGGKR